MKEALEVVDKIIRTSTDGVHVAKLGRVEKYNPDEQTADIQPLPTSEGDIIMGVPVLNFRTANFFIYNPLRRGDIVLMVFIDNDIDGVLMGQNTKTSNRRHNLADAICIGGIPTLNKPIEIERKNDLIISNIEGTGEIRLNRRGDLNIKANRVIIEAEDVDLRDPPKEEEEEEEKGNITRPPKGGKRSV